MPGALNISAPTRQSITDRQAGFTDGLNTVSDPAALTQAQARVLTNYRLSHFGSASRRGGTQNLSLTHPNPGNPVQGGLWWPGGAEYVIQAGTNLYTGNTPVIPVTWTSIAGAAGNIFDYPAMKVFVGENNNEAVYVADGDTVGLKKWDGTTFSNGISAIPGLVNTPVVDGLEVYNQRLWGWLWSGVVQPNILYYSNLSTATLSVGGDSLGVAAENGGEIIIQTFSQSGIVACKVIGTSLVIFHLKGISRLTGFGQSDITVTPQSISSDFSLIGRDAVTAYAGVGFAVSTLGMYAVTEGNITPIGTPAKPDPLPQAIAQSTNPAQTQVGYNIATQEVWIQIPEVGLYVYQTQLQSWSGPWTGPYAAGTGFLFSYPGNALANQAPYLVYCDDVGTAMQTDMPTTLDYVASDGSGGTPFTTIVQCHRMFGGSAYIPGTEATLPVGASLSKSWRMANVLATLSSGFDLPTLTATTLYGGTTSTQLTNQNAAQKTYYTAIGGAGPYVDITLTDGGNIFGGSVDIASVDVVGVGTGNR